MHLKINHFIAIGPIFACKRTKWVKGVWDPLKSCFSPEAQVGMRKSPCLELLLAPFWCMTTALWVVLERTTKTSSVRLRRHASHVCALQNLFDLSQGGCIFFHDVCVFLSSITHQRWKWLAGWGAEEPITLQDGAFFCLEFPLPVCCMKPDDKYTAGGHPWRCKVWCWSKMGLWRGGLSRSALNSAVL